MADPKLAVSTTKPLTTAGMVLGIGMGGFVDGVVFHQILQLHNMLCAQMPTDLLMPFFRNRRLRDSDHRSRVR